MSKSVYVTITDEEGFNTGIVGPFTKDEGREFVDKMNSEYQGDLQEPYQSFTITPVDEFVAY